MNQPCSSKINLFTYQKDENKPKSSYHLRFDLARIHENYISGILSACPAYSGLADFGLEKTLPLYFVDEKHLVGIK